MLSGCQCFPCLFFVRTVSKHFLFSRLERKGVCTYIILFGIGGGTRFVDGSQTLGMLCRQWSKNKLYIRNKTKRNNNFKKITVWLLRSDGCDGHISSFVWHAELTNCLPSVGRNTSSISTMDGSSLKRPSSFFFFSFRSSMLLLYFWAAAAEHSLRIGRGEK